MLEDSNEKSFFEERKIALPVGLMKLPYDMKLIF